MRQASNSASHSESQSSTSPGQKDGSLADTPEIVRAGATEGTGATGVVGATEGGGVEEGIEASEEVIVRFVGRQFVVIDEKQAFCDDERCVCIGAFSTRK